MAADLTTLEKLPVWTGPVRFEKLSGGITNVNYLARDIESRYVVRIGEDIPVHQVMRFNELAASQAGYAAGISPRVVYHSEGILVLDYIESQTLTAEMVCEQSMLERILPLIKSCHREMPKHLRGAMLMFWVFHVIRDYAATLEEGGSQYIALLPELLSIAEDLEAISNPTEIVFGHNDLLPANFLDDGQRLWLIDWDYAGFNSPLFDLGGLASNNALSVQQEIWLLENYFDEPVSDELLHQYQAMKCASLLRETMWSMVSEIHSQIAFDYVAYSQDNLSAFQAAYRLFKQS
ncbi:MAG: phosphotransferase family protein [Gammaproteobacteria bacterium]|nr:phosphotransferase family protein [Gammaproteobacteria bacterium]